MKGFIIALAIVLALTALVLCMIKGCANEKINDIDSLPSSNQLLLGYKEIGKVVFEYNILETNVMNDVRFSGYGLRDEYCMVYLATDSEQEKELIEFLGIKDELPMVDYKKKYLLLSVGHPITDMSDKFKRTAESGEKVIDFSFDKTYSKDTAYVYSMNRIEFLSGNELEVYYMENLHPNSNLEEVERDQTQIISDGKYHRIYQKAEEVYEFVIYNADNEVSSRKILNTLPLITEYNDTMVKLEYENKDQYYNPMMDLYSKQSNYSLNYLLDNIIVFVKFTDNGMLNLIVRDIYNTAKYSYVVTLPYECSEDRLREFLHSVEYVDSTHIRVEYYFGEDQPIKEDLLTVPNLDKNLSGN